MTTDTRSALDLLYSLYMMCVNAKPGAFSNGVTDSTGTIDEGEVRAGELLDEVAQFLIKAGKLRRKWQ